MTYACELTQPTSGWSLQISYFFQMIRHWNIVMIKNSKILTSCHLDQSVAGRSDAKMLLIDSIDDTRIIIWLYNLPQIWLSWLIIQNNEFKIGICLLIQYAFYTCPEMIFPCTVDGNQDWYFRNHYQILQDFPNHAIFLRYFITLIYFIKQEQLAHLR